MNVYIYEGPVLSFGKEICRHWHAETTAVSEAKAISNLKARFRRENNLTPNKPLEFPNSIMKRSKK